MLCLDTSSCAQTRDCVCQRDHQNFCFKIHTVTLGVTDLWSPVCRRSGRSKIMKFTSGRHVCRPKWSCVPTSISLIQTQILFAGNRPSVLIFETRRGIIQLSRLVFVLDRKHMTQTQRVSLRSCRIAFKNSCEELSDSWCCESRALVCFAKYVLHASTRSIQRWIDIKFRSEAGPRHQQVLSATQARFGTRAPS